MEKMGKQLNLGIHETMTDFFFKSRVGSIIVSVKAKEICGHVIQSQEMLSPV